MRNVHFRAAFAVLLFAAILPAAAQNQPKTQQPPPAAPAKPYKAVAITPPKPMSDPSFDALRKQLGEAAQKKDRAALARLVATDGFFWARENGNGADKRKSGVDNLAAALGLAKKDSVGWDILADYAEDPTASLSADHKNAICAPANPAFNAKEFDDLTSSTQTDVSDWAYTVSAGIEVRAAPQANAPVIDKFGLIFVRVMPEPTPASPAFLRVVTPAGKAGYVSADAIAPIGNDQICYVKDGGGWKIGGYIGGGEPQ